MFTRLNTTNTFILFYGSDDMLNVTLVKIQLYDFTFYSNKLRSFSKEKYINLIMKVHMNNCY